MRFILFTLFFISLIPVNAQDTLCVYKLHGKVMDEHDRQPLPYANVYIQEVSKGAVSDSLGYYSIENLCKGDYTVQVSHLGCETLTLKLSLKGNLKKDFFLEHHPYVLDLLDIIAEGPDKHPIQVKAEITGQELEETRGEPLGESLKKAPGVTTVQTGASISKPVIHGLHSNRVLVLNNGIRQEGQQWGMEHGPEIDPYIASKVTVIKGANSVRYGSDAMGGVILVEPEKLPSVQGIRGNLNLGAFSNNRQVNSSLMMQGKLGPKFPLSWRVQGTAKKAGNMKAPDYYLKNTGFEEYNFSYALGLDRTKYGAEFYYSQFNTRIGIFSASHIGNLTDLKKAFTAERPLETALFTYDIDHPFQNIEHELVKAKLYWKPQEKSNISLTLARQYNFRQEFDKHGSLEHDEADIELRLTTYTSDLIWEHKLHSDIKGSVGFNGIMQANTFDGMFFIPNYRSQGAGGYLIEGLEKEKYELEAGVRYDQKWLQAFLPDNNGTGEVTYQWNNFSGNFGGTFKPDTGWYITLNTGTAWRTPAVNELFSEGLHHGAAAIETGNPELSTEIAYNAISSFQYIGENWDFYISPYLNYISNYIYLQPQPEPVLTIRGAFPAFNYEQTDAIFTGVDNSLTINFWENFQYSFKYSLLRATNVETKKGLYLIPADRVSSEIKFNFPARKNYEQAYVSFTALKVFEQTNVDPASDFVPPPDGYFLFGINGAVTFYFGKQPVEFGVGVDNLLNTSYRNYLNRFRYFADEMGRNFKIRIKVPFNLSKHLLND